MVVQQNQNELRSWYLAHLRRRLIEQAHNRTLTPAALVKADQEVIERAITKRASEESARKIDSNPTGDANQAFATVSGIALLAWSITVLVALVLYALRTDPIVICESIILTQAIALLAFLFFYKNSLSARLSRISETTQNIQMLSRQARAIVDYSRDIVCCLNSEGIIETIGASINALGYEPEMLAGQELILYLDERGAIQLHSVLQELPADRQEARFDASFKTFGGDYLHYRWLAQWSHTAQRLYCVAEDITADKKLEKAKAEVSSI